MDITREQPIRCYRAGVASARADTLVVETRVELDINDGRLRWAMLCLPENLDALAVGFLRSEGVLRSRADLHEVLVQPDARRVCLRGDFDEDALDTLTSRWTWGTGCGSGGTGQDLTSPRGDIENSAATQACEMKISADTLLQLGREFDGRAKLWRATGGVHACALAGADGLAIFAEDVGRHNAFDKIVGLALLGDIDLAGKVILSTGRLSAEIVSKAMACGATMLVSRSAVTALAVDLGKKFNITLVGFARGERLNIYTGFERVDVGK